MDRPKPECKLLLVLKNFKGLRYFVLLEMAFFAQLKRNLSGKVIFFGKFL
jgi:hypothetical protein